MRAVMCFLGVLMTQWGAASAESKFLSPHSQLIKKLVLSGTLLSFCITAFADKDYQLEKAIQEQVLSATVCDTLAYSIHLKHLDADEIFRGCVERRAILIAMQRRYGAGHYGKIDVVDKIQAYSFLANSQNKRVQQEASTFDTAAGIPEQ